MSSSPIVEMTGAISRRTGKKKKYSNPLSTLQLWIEGGGKICVGRKMRLNSVPFPFRAAAKPPPIAHVAKVANFAAKGHVTIHFASSP